MELVSTRYMGCVVTEINGNIVSTQPLSKTVRVTSFDKKAKNRIVVKSLSF